MTWANKILRNNEGVEFEVVVAENDVQYLLFQCDMKAVPDKHVLYAMIILDGSKNK